MIRVTTLAIAVLLVASHSHAADLASATVLPGAPPIEADFDSRWEGPYAIGLVGRGWANVSTPASSGQAWTAGAAIGINRTRGPLVFGVEIDAMWSDRATSFYEVPWTTSLRSRWGVANDHFHFYGTGGVAATHINGVAPLNSSTEWGWAAGGGLEAAAGDHVLARVEYLYSRFGNIAGTSMPLATHEVRWGLGARF